MKNKSNSVNILMLGVITLTMTISLTSCGIISTQSEEEKFSSIDKVTSQVEYEKAGTIVQEEREPGNSNLDPSNFSVSLEGEKPFYIIKEKLFRISGINCHVDDENLKVVGCYLDQISIGLTIEEQKPGSIYTVLRLSDPYSGRK